jgi:isopenicillin N synthase-like dioxygenase
MAITTVADGLVGRAVAFQEIPIVDVGALVDGSDPEAVAEALGHAAATVGFVYVRNHGVPADLRAAMMAEAERFFAQPLETKNALHIRNSKIHRGYFSLFEENTDPGLTADLKEGLDIGRELGPDDPEVRRGLPLHGPNQWPTDLPGFRTTTDAYFTAMRSLAETLMRGFALALDLTPDFFADKIDQPCASLRLLHYPPQEGQIEAKTMGCGAHTDYGCLTILAQDANGGLQVRNSAGEWIAAPPVPDTFVINLGDQMARWTNGRFQATPHRVINTSGRERYSMPFFFDPNWDALIEALPGTVPSGEAPKFAPVLAGPYLQSRFDDTFAYRKTEAAKA